MKAQAARAVASVRCWVLSVAVIAAVAGPAHPLWSQSRETVAIRGHQQSVYVYGNPQGEPIIVSSGDGGWIHLGPHVAEFLASRGFFVMGFDVKVYLSSFTSERSTLRPDDEPADYRVLTELAKKRTGRKPILIGVSEGAGLSVLAGTDPDTKADVSGVIGLGLPDLNELGWRWKDSLIYLTHKPPNEPAFSATTVVRGLAPLPIALLQSTHDEFVPLAETQRIFAQASEPKRLWVIDAVNHRFSNNLPEFDTRLMEAIAWVQHNQPR